MGPPFWPKRRRVPVQVSAVPYALADADQALRDLAHDRVNGAAVLVNDTGW